MGLFTLKLWYMADDELTKNENSNLCRQPAVEEQVQSRAGLKAPTNSLCKSMSVGQFVLNK